MTALAILGAGKMGEALLSGLLRAGTSPGDVVVTARRQDRADALTQRYGVAVAPNAEAARAVSLSNSTVVRMQLS